MGVRAACPCTDFKSQRLLRPNLRNKDWQPDTLCLPNKSEEILPNAPNVHSLIRAHELRTVVILTPRQGPSDQELTRQGCSFVFEGGQGLHFSLLTPHVSDKPPQPLKNTFPQDKHPSLFQNCYSRQGMIPDSASVSQRTDRSVLQHGGLSPYPRTHE